jgi:hypothetical protein
MSFAAEIISALCDVRGRLSRLLWSVRASDGSDLRLFRVADLVFVGPLPAFQGRVKARLWLSMYS